MCVYREYKILFRFLLNEYSFIYNLFILNFAGIC